MDKEGIAADLQLVAQALLDEIISLEARIQVKSDYAGLLVENAKLIFEDTKTNLQMFQSDCEVCTTTDHLLKSISTIKELASEIQKMEVWINGR